MCYSLEITFKLDIYEKKAFCALFVVLCADLVATYIVVLSLLSLLEVVFLSLEPKK